MEIREITPEEMAKVIETRKPEGLFYSKREYNGYVACDNSTGEAWTEEFNTIEGAIAFLADDEDKKCYGCGSIIESYVYSYTIYLKNGEEIVVDDIVSEDVLEDIEEEVKTEYGEQYDYIVFGEYCPHCLVCM